MAAASSWANNFYPRPPRGGRPGQLCIAATCSHFYPRPPRGGRLLSILGAERSNVISIHALREEGDRSPAPAVQPVRNFYPRPPRGGRPARADRREVGAGISIHALREEGDVAGHQRPTHHRSKFLSTPSARRATPSLSRARPCGRYFYPRPPRGGRPERAAGMGKACAISIHALREEGDPRGWVLLAARQRFLSTPSARRATVTQGPEWPEDYEFLSTPSARRATQRGGLDAAQKLLFLSTPSARRATASL